MIEDDLILLYVLYHRLLDIFKYKIEDDAEYLENISLRFSRKYEAYASGNSQKYTREIINLHFSNIEKNFVKNNKYKDAPYITGWSKSY